MGLRLSHLIGISILLALGVSGIVYALFFVEATPTGLSVEEISLTGDKTKMEFVLVGTTNVAEPIRPTVKLSSGFKHYTIEAAADFLLMPSQSNKVLLDFDSLSVDNGEYTLEAYVLTTDGRSESLFRTFTKQGSSMTISQASRSTSPGRVFLLGGIGIIAIAIFFTGRNKLPFPSLAQTAEKPMPTTDIHDKEGPANATVTSPAVAIKDIVDREQLDRDLKRLRELCEQNLIDIETYKAKRQEILKKLQPQQS